MGNIEAGEHCLRIGDFTQARKHFGYARRENPNDWRAWFGLACVVTRNFTVFTGENWERFLETAKSLTIPSNVAMMDAKTRDYKEKVKLMQQMRHPKRYV